MLSILDYQENRSLGTTRWTDRIVSTSDDWSGNVFDFVIEALRRMQQGLKVPFVLKGNLRVDDTPIHKLLCEAITNACVYADFYGRQGLVIQKSEEGYKLSNPGSVRISISEAVNGGISDPRNGIMLKIFSLIEFGERAGSGLSGICKVWGKVYRTPVTIEETHNNGVDRTILTLSTGGNEQDVKAMLKLYGDLIETPEPQPDQVTAQRVSDTTQSEPQNDQKTVANPQNEPQNEKEEPQNRTQEVHKSKDAPQRLLETVRMNSKITKTALSELLGGSSSTLKRWLKANNIVWIGHSKNGHWEILKVEHK